MRQSVVLRVRSQAIVIRAFTALMIFFSIGEVFDHDGDAGLAVEPLVVPLVFSLIVVGWRFGWAGIGVSRDGLRVRNVLSTREVLWEDIERFEIGASRLVPLTSWIVLRSGTIVSMIAASGPDPVMFPRTTSAQRIYDALNAGLIAARAGHDPVDAVTLATRRPPRARPSQRSSRRMDPAAGRLKVAVVAPAILTTLGSLVGRGPNSLITGWSATIAILSVPAWLLLFDLRRRGWGTWLALAIVASAGAVGGLALRSVI